MDFYSDCHIHTAFSPDSATAAEKMIERAVQLGLQHIAITDHFDPRHPENMIGIADPDAYVSHLKELKQKYAKDIYVSIGVELGYMSLSGEDVKQFTLNRDIEYIINSVHVVGGIDCYNKRFFKERTQKEVYVEYLTTVYESVNACYRYDAVGHVGYVARKAPYKDPAIAYEIYHDWLDHIFDTIIEREKILEVNTSANGRSISVPSPELLRAYYERGGRLITFSSDAHDCKRIASGFAAAAKMAAEIGFTYITVKQNGKYKTLEL